LALLAASFVFGATFVVIKTAVEDYPPVAFVAWRFLLGAAALALFALAARKVITRSSSTMIRCIVPWPGLSVFFIVRNVLLRRRASGPTPSGKIITQNLPII